MQLKLASTYPHMRGTTLGEGGFWPRAREARNRIGLARKPQRGAVPKEPKFVGKKDGEGPDRISDVKGLPLD